MFRTFFLAVVLSTFLQSPVYSQLKFQIDGQIDNTVYSHPDFNIKDGDFITLEFINVERIDTAIVADGKFRFSGEVAIPSVAMVHHKSGGTLVLLDESTYKITFAIEEVAPGRYGYSDVHVEAQSKFYNLWRTLGREKGNLNTTQREIQTLLDGELTEAERNVYLLELEEVDMKLSNLYKEASIQHDASYEMTYLLPAAPDFSYTRYIDYYNRLPVKIKNSYYGKHLYQRLLETKPQ